MTQVVIENPIINSPFAEPTRHLKFNDEGITDEIVEERRISTHFVPRAFQHDGGRRQAQV